MSIEWNDIFSLKSDKLNQESQSQESVVIFGLAFIIALVTMLISLKIVDAKYKKIMIDILSKHQKEIDAEANMILKRYEIGISYAHNKFFRTMVNNGYKHEWDEHSELIAQKKYSKEDISKLIVRTIAEEKATNHSSGDYLRLDPIIEGSLWDYLEENELFETISENQLINKFDKIVNKSINEIETSFEKDKKEKMKLYYDMNPDDCYYEITIGVHTDIFEYIRNAIK